MEAKMVYSCFPTHPMFGRCCVLLLLIAGITVQAIAQDGQDPQPAKDTKVQREENPPEPEAHGTRLEWKDLPKNIWRDQKDIWTSPFHINRDNAKWWALFGGGTAALIATDKKFSKHLSD
jgi:hypothetical protein